LVNLNSIRTPPLRPDRLTKNPNVRRLLHQGWRHTQRLFHTAVGILFLLLAAAGATQSFAEWKAYTQRPMNGMWRFEVVAAFTLLLLIFGLYSFLKARSLR
jgi:hypothetical protein